MPGHRHVWQDAHGRTWGENCTHTMDRSRGQNQPCRHIAVRHPASSWDAINVCGWSHIGCGPSLLWRWLTNTPTHTEGENREGASLWTPRAAAPPASGSAGVPTLPWAISVILLTTPLLEAPRSHILRFRVCPRADEDATVSHAGRLPRRSPTPPPRNMELPP